MGTDNLHHKRKARHASELRRREATRESYDRVLIVTEGGKTEPNYFEELKDYYQLSSANIKIAGDCHSSPIHVVNCARQLFREAKDAGNPFQRVFCVFDRDSHSDYQRALDIISRIKPHGVFFSTPSIPCFEYWLLLHFQSTDSPFEATGTRSACAAVLQALKRHWPEYEKANSGTFMDRINELDYAKANAERILKASRQHGNENPSTHIHELVTYLQNLKNRDVN